MVHALSHWLQIALDFVFPAECVYCHNVLNDDRVTIFCQSCWSKIPLISGPVCPKCGSPYTSEAVLRHTPHFICGECRNMLPHFDRAFAPTFYEQVLREAVHQFKFHHKRGLGRHLAQLMIRHLPADIDISQYHLILPVPLHKSRQRQRGYNQAAILAKYLSRHYQIPLMANALIRVRHTESQTQLKRRKARQQNVNKAFDVKMPSLLHAKQVILVDDVMTTGATVNECAKTLKKAGVKFVLVLTLSRAGVRSAF